MDVLCTLIPHEQNLKEFTRLAKELNDLIAMKEKRLQARADKEKSA